MKDSRRLWSLVLSVLLPLVAVGVPGAIVARNQIAKRKVAAVESQLRRIAVGVEAHFVDNCSELPPERGNALPPRLTTPVMYVKGPELRDPFSPTGRPLHYYNQEGRGNGTLYVLSSCGPDGVMDMEKLPDHGVIYAPVGPGHLGNAPSIKIKYADKPAELEEQPYWWRANVEYYYDARGKKVQNTTFTVSLLPKDDASSAWRNKEELVRYLLRHGCTLYDPTNGLKSPGDIIRTNAQ